MKAVVFGLLVSLAAPLILLPIEKLFPYPYLLEEMVKLLIVVMIIQAEMEIKKNLWRWALLAGFIFAFSESVLYLVNIFALANLWLFPQRLLLTSLLHTTTLLLMYLFGRRGRFCFALGFIAAVLIHLYYNLFINLFI